MSQYNRPRIVQLELVREIAPGVLVIPDQHIDLVPNIGIVIGTGAVLGPIQTLMLPGAR